jgi:hypothetical protein
MSSIMSRTMNKATLALLVGLALSGAASAQGGGGGGGGGGGSGGGADVNARDIMNPPMPASRANNNCITRACENEPDRARPQRARSACEGHWLLARDPETWRIVRICERS